jgi:ferrochelatase
MGMKAPIGVLLMAYGGPDSLDDVLPYLADIRGGRPISPELAAEIRSRYAQIGGRSPLLEITRAQAAALAAELNRRADGSETSFRAYVGMRHWQPRIQAAVSQMQADGVREVIALAMSPHYARLYTGAYFEQLEAAIAGLGADIQVTRIEGWHVEPGLIAALAENASTVMAHFERAPYVLFTAHSLPVRLLQAEDTYDRHLHQTAGLVADRLALAPNRWQFCYQSAGQSAEPWLGPAVETVIRNLAQAGERDLLVVPVGFVADHVEVLYDLDIAARQLASQHGARLERSSSLNTSPTFIAGLADTVWSYAHPLPRH